LQVFDKVIDELLNYHEKDALSSKHVVEVEKLQVEKIQEIINQKSELQELKQKILDSLEDGFIEQNDLANILMQCGINKITSNYIASYIKFKDYERIVYEIINLILKGDIDKNKFQKIINEYNENEFNIDHLEFCPYCGNPMQDGIQCLSCGYTK